MKSNNNVMIENCQLLVDIMGGILFLCIEWIWVRLERGTRTDWVPARGGVQSKLDSLSYSTLTWVHKKIICSRVWMCFCRNYVGDGTNLVWGFTCGKNMLWDVYILDIRLFIFWFQDSIKWELANKLVSLLFFIISIIIFPSIGCRHKQH